MINSISKRICKYLYKNSVIDSEEIQLYEFGMSVLLMNLLNILTMLFFGIILKVVWESLVFIGLYMILKKYTGGYHAKRLVSCYLFTSILNLIVLIAIKNINIIGQIPIIIIIILISFFCIVFIAPLESPNKPITKRQLVQYKKYTYYIWAGELLLLLGACLYNIQKIVIIILLNFILVDILLILGKLDNFME